MNRQPSSLEKTLKEISSLISLPEIYLKIRRLMDDPNSSMEEFCKVVGCDPNLSATVLKVVNSAFFGFPGQIDNVRRAVVMLGTGQVHDVVLATSAISALAMPNVIWPLQSFWRCSLLTGVLTGILARRLKIIKSERLFIVGLLHEIGHLVIYSKFPEQAKQAKEHSLAANAPLHIHEQNLLGLHYGQVGAKLMAQWQLPVSFQLITQYHPTPADAREFPAETAIVHLAHAYAHAYQCDNCQALEQLIAVEAWQIAGLQPVQIDECWEETLETCREMEKTIFQ